MMIFLDVNESNDITAMLSSTRFKASTIQTNIVEYLKEAYPL